LGLFLVVIMSQVDIKATTTEDGKVRNLIFRGHK
jgi:hypothetical protein